MTPKFLSALLAVALVAGGAAIRAQNLGATAPARPAGAASGSALAPDRYRSPQEANAALEPLLGAKPFEAYKQYGGGWLRTLVPATPNRPPNPVNSSTPPGSTAAAPKS